MLAVARSPRAGASPEAGHGRARRADAGRRRRRVRRGLARPGAVHSHRAPGAGAVEPLPVQDQIEALDVHSFNLFRTETHSRQRHGRRRCWPAWASTTRQRPPSCAATPTFRAQLLGAPAARSPPRPRDNHALQKLSARWAPDDDGTFKRLVIERTPQGRFASRVETAPLVAATRMGSGVVRTSLFAAADEARMPDARGRPDGRDLLQRHRFPPRRCARATASTWCTKRSRPTASRCAPAACSSAEFVNDGQLLPGHVVPGAGPARAATTRWTARAWSSAYLASPLEFSRVTSGFAMRFHPILHMEAHQGVDYGAADRHAGARRGRRHRRIRGRAERLRQRGRSSSTTTANRRSTRT